MELYALARNPVPSGAVTGTVKGFDGTPLRFARFQATRGPRQGTMCIFPGRTEYIEKYFEVIADLRRRGFAVAILDWRGQGGSQRPLPDRFKGHVTDFSEFDRDLACFMREIVLPDCPPPYVALGHSMGANVLLRNAASPGSWFERMILTAPMLALHPRQLKAPLWASRAGAEAACLVGLGTQYAPGRPDWRENRVPFETNLLTTDRERYTRNRTLLEAAPELGLGGPTIAWVRAAFRSMAMMQDQAFPRRVSLPILMFIAGKDEVVLPSAIEDFSALIKSGTHVILADAKHEVLQEADDIRGRFWAAFDAYMDIGQKV